MLHVRLCTIRRENVDEAFGFELWRSKRKPSTTGASTTSPPPTPEFDESTDLLIVKSVYAASPAQKGDLRENDKIIAVDGVNVRDAKNVRDLLAKSLEVRVMVERWEGPMFQYAERKASTPMAQQRATTRTNNAAPETSRRRSNTLRSAIESITVNQWPRNYGSAQNYPSASNSSSRDRNASSSATTAARSVSFQPDGPVSNQRRLASDENEPSSSSSPTDRRSILDVCPEGRFLLNAAGRGFFSDDMRGD